jgi:HEAT repeat protein
VAFVVMVVGGPAQSAALDAASPAELIQILKANVYLTGDIVKRLAAQKRLERLGKRDPQAVVPLVIKELAAPKTYGKIAGHQRLALIELLRDLGPAAEASVPQLLAILADPEEPYESVKMQAAAALHRIGTPQAKAAVKAHFSGVQRDYARKANTADATRSLAQSAFLIRQQLRRREPADGVIAASIDSLTALGRRAAPALPTLLRAFNDRRLGSALHKSVGNAVRSAGVRDVEVAATRAAAQRGAPDILAETIAETRHRDAFVRSLAMTELGQMGVSEPAIEAMIAALREGRNPGDAARVLGGFGKQAARALPQIARYFDDERSGANAIQAAGKIGVHDPAAVAGLRRVLATPGHRNRGQAASALGRLGATEAIPDLQQALADGRKYDRILSAKALGRMGPAAAKAVPALTATLDQSDLDLKRVAVVALGQIGEAAASAAAAISRHLDSGDRRLKTAARRALVKIGGPRADVALQQDASRFADADHAEIRRLAATRGMKGMMKFLFMLPERRARPLARRMVSDQQGDSAYIGALFLARHGDTGHAVPILVDNLGCLFQEMTRYAEENRDRYTTEERTSLDGLLKSGTGWKRR